MLLYIRRNSFSKFLIGKMNPLAFLNYCLEVTLSILLAALPVAAAERMTAVQKCELGPCLMMEVNYPEKRLPEAKDLGHGFGEFTVPVSGRLGDGPVTFYLLSLKANTDGIACDNFGQAFVAVQGIKNGHALLKTSRGNLEVIDSNFEVGCPDCIQIVDKKSGRQISVIRTPSSDLHLLNFDKMYIDNRGAVWLKGANGGCNGLVWQGDFDVERESYSCQRAGLHELSNSQSIQKDSRLFSRYDVPSLPFFIDVFSDSCS